MSCSMNLTLLSTALALSLAVPPAGASSTEVLGGPGGGPFLSKCRAGQVVRGFHASAGAWVNGLAVLCAPWRNGGAPADGTRALRWVAGSGGPLQSAYCSSQQPVTGLLLTHTRGNGLKRQYVNSIGLICSDRQRVQTCISSGEGCGSLAPAVRGLLVRTVKDYANDYVQCPADEVLVGIRGRHGAFIDAVGLICAAAGAR